MKKIKSLKLHYQQTNFVVRIMMIQTQDVDKYLSMITGNLFGLLKNSRFLLQKIGFLLLFTTSPRHQSSPSKSAHDITKKT